MKRARIGLLVCSVLAIGAAGSARAATWTLDPAKSRLGFVGTQSGEAFKGTFKTWTATIEFDPAKPEAAHVAVTIDVASATTGDAQKDAAMPEADWFAASQFAKATFEATGFVSTGKDAYRTTGKLSLRGVSKDVTLPFSLSISGDQAHAVGQAKLVRTDFGVGQGQWANDQIVALDVEVDVDLVATRQ